MSQSNDIKKGIKQVELDRGKFNISIFVATVYGLISGGFAGLLFGAVVGCVVGVIVLLWIGVPAGDKYFETDKDK